MSQDPSKILFDRFEITDTLKKDQYTTVYLANHIYLGKKIILKTLSAEELSDKTALDRFKREAKILAQLDHPNIIKVLDFGMSENSFYISFEYFESNDLRKVIKQNNITDDEKINLCVQLFKALDTAHQRGIIHRDIKPENVLINSKLELKIADFGLALVRDEHILTQKTSIVGTPGYMSPEQIRGEELSPQTDLFSSGIVIYELFTGKNPLIGKDISETINNILNFKVEKDFKEISTLPSEIQDALQNLLRKNFSKRTKTALEALTYFKSESKIIEKPVEDIKYEKPKRKYLFWFAGVFIVALSILLFNQYFSESNSPTINNDTQDKNTILIPEKKDSALEELKNENKNTDEKSNLINNQKELPKEETEEKPNISSDGKLFVEVSPWAEVYLNDKNIGTTPFDQEIRLKPGKYELKLVHNDFPTFTDSVEIQPGELSTVKINFYEEVGYLDCKIFPWGDIYINGTYRNTTPLRKPMVLMPGVYQIKISNPGYSNSIEEKINIVAKEKVMLKYNFDDLGSQ